MTNSYTHLFQPNNWFTSIIEYEGWGVAEFESPKGTLEGPVKIHFDGQGEATIELDVQKYDIREPLYSGFSRWSVFFSATPPFIRDSQVVLDTPIFNPCARLYVKTKEGEYTAIEDINYTPSYALDDSSAHIRFRLGVAQFDLNNSKPPKYCVLPLTNLLTDFHQQDISLLRHPLRVYPAPDIPNETPNDIISWATFQAEERNRLVVFEFGGKKCFIEKLPNYEENKKKLESDQARIITTAVMVIELGHQNIEYSYVENWFPFDFLFLLSLATGVEIGAPWIEFRDADGELVRRTHIELWLQDFAHGHASLFAGFPGYGIGYLLTQAVTSSHFGKLYLRFALRHTVRGLSEKFSLEDRLTHLIRALESLCKHFNVSSQALLPMLEDAQKQIVRDAVSEAGKKIRRAKENAQKAGQISQKQALAKIEGRLSNAANKDVDFGLAVVALLDLFDFADAKVVESFYTVNPRRDNLTWDAVLSHYRGTTIHTGYFDLISPNQFDFDDLIRIMNHLHDILVRVLLKMLNYDATYRISVQNRGSQFREVDWVKPETSASDLGYVTTSTFTYRGVTS